MAGGNRYGARLRALALRERDARSLAPPICVDVIEERFVIVDAAVVPREEFLDRPETLFVVHVEAVVGESDWLNICRGIRSSSRLCHDSAGALCQFSAGAGRGCSVRTANGSVRSSLAYPRAAGRTTARGGRGEAAGAGDNVYST